MKRWLKVSIAVAALLTMSNAMACIADVGTATTEVYVRDIKTGDVVGSLYTGDHVEVTGKKGDWYAVKIGGNEYKVYGQYLDVTEGDEVEGKRFVDKPRKSKSGGKKQTIRDKQSAPIAGSAFDGISFW